MFASYLRKIWVRDALSPSVSPTKLPFVLIFAQFLNIVLDFKLHQIYERFAPEKRRAEGRRRNGIARRAAERHFLRRQQENFNAKLFYKRADPHATEESRNDKIVSAILMYFAYLLNQTMKVWSERVSRRSEPQCTMKRINASANPSRRSEVKFNSKRAKCKAPDPPKERKKNERVSVCKLCTSEIIFRWKLRKRLSPSYSFLLDSAKSVRFSSGEFAFWSHYDLFILCFLCISRHFHILPLLTLFSGRREASLYVHAAPLLRCIALHAFGSCSCSCSARSGAAAAPSRHRGYRNELHMRPNRYAGQKNVWALNVE